MKETFEMVAKTMQGLEEVLAEELRNLGALNVLPGRRMVSFEGDLEMLYKANLSLRTALRVLKPICKFNAQDPDELYEAVKEFDWGSVLSLDKTFCIDTVAYSDEFTHTQFVTYRVKDAIVDWFRDRYGDDKRPNVRLEGADVMINVHIAADRVTLSLDSSGESLHKRGYRVAQTEAPINEVLAAGIILRSGWRGDCPFVDPMCGSGTFLIEAALIAANINPGIYREHFAFRNWPDYDEELFQALYQDDSAEREVHCPILGADISPRAAEIALANIKSAGMGKYISLEVKPLVQWTEAPADGVLVTNPPYGERISAPDMEGLYEMIGSKLKNVFKGYHAWIIGYRREYFDAIHLSPSQKIAVFNGSLECELREYIMFEGNYRDFRKQGGRIHFGDDKPRGDERPRRETGYAKRHRDENADGATRRERFGDRPRSQEGGEERPMRDRKPRFGDNERRPRFGDKSRETRFGDRGKRRDDRRDDKRGDRRDAGRKAPFARRVERPETPEQPSENPLAKHNMPGLLDNFTVKRPTLSMRHRKNKGEQED